MLTAPLPIEWSRTYRSNLAAYDQGSLGARWITPYSSRVDVKKAGKMRSLVYHGSDGRSHKYPWLDVGQRLRDPIEEVTLTRLSPTLLVLDFGKPLPEGEPSPWRESYELVTTCPGKVDTQGEQHFRLVALQAENGAGIGLRYDHVVGMGPNLGEEVLSDILSKQGDQIIAHMGTQLDVRTGRIHAVWELQDGKLVRQLAAYQHDDAGDLIVAQDENAAPWQYQYQNHLITRYTDRTGRGMNLQYDGTEANAKAIREWADDGSFDVRMRWDKHIRLAIMTDALGGETWVYYDILGYLYRMIHPDEREEWFYRDDAKNVIRHTHPDGTADNYRFDPDGNLQSHVRADGSVVHFEYDKLNRLTGILDAEGGTWRREYNVQGHMVAEIDPRGLKTEYAYDKAGQPIQITDAKGGAKTLSYTTQGQLSSYTDCSGQTSRWVYDDRGRLKESIDAKGHSTRYRYTDIGERFIEEWETPNHAGQLEAVIQADGTEEHLVHDAEGRLLSHTDALEQRTRYSYTASGLIAQRKDALGQTLKYSWDRMGRLKELRNENDRAYRFEYDSVGRLLRERGFDDQTTTYRYEKSTGVLAEVIEGLQKPEAPEQPETYILRTRLEFDPMGRLTERHALVPGQAEQTERFAYNANGQLIQADNAHSKLQWFFDAAGNLVREHHHDLSQKQTAIWRHRYDELNQRVGTTRPDGHTLEWLTYGSGHVHGLVLDGQERVGFERDELHREIQRSQGNGLSQQQRFDAVGRLLEQIVVGKSHQGPMEMGRGAFKYNETGTTVALPAAILRKYKYDKAGQLSMIDDTRRGHIEYRYDPVGRLLKAQSAMGYESFAFDPAGNIQQPKGTYQDPLRGHTGNKVMDNLIKEYAGTHYKFDERGNLIERLHQGRRTVFEWDAFNRMTTARSDKGTSSFAYDPLGRRISKHYQPSDIYQGARPYVFSPPPRQWKREVAQRN